ncbi:MAG: hypothetical protein V4719_00940 [Planctomycetota bacterium]
MLKTCPICSVTHDTTCRNLICPHEPIPLLPANIPDVSSISEWITQVIDGPGGMNNYEETEWVVWHTPERHAAAAWIIRCLANPKCKGSDEVLAAIRERRQEIENR